jgi:hypothetical protein
MAVTAGLLSRCLIRAVRIDSSSSPWTPPPDSVPYAQDHQAGEVELG